MKQVFKQRDDGTIDFIDSIVVNSVVPKGYVEVTQEDQGKYNSEGRKLTEAELEAIQNSPQPVSELEQIKKQQADLVFTLMMNGVL
jgi:hypothetical protein